MELVAVDHPHPDDVAEIAAVLTRAGLHPRYDDAPRYALRGRSPSTTPLLVPMDEESEARAALSRYYEAASDRIAKKTKGLWRPLLLPAGLALAIGGVVWLLTGNLTIGLGVVLVGTIIVLQLIALFRGNW